LLYAGFFLGGWGVDLGFLQRGKMALWKRLPRSNSIFLGFSKFFRPFHVLAKVFFKVASHPDGLRKKESETKGTHKQHNVKKNKHKLKIRQLVADCPLL